MWPSARPSVPGLDYHAAWRGGQTPNVDYLDYFETEGGNFALALGELVAGNASADDTRAAAGPGALLLSSLHALVRSLDAGTDPQFLRDKLIAELVHSIHDLFYELAPEGSYATLFLARFDPIERRLDYCNAGHDAPVVLRKSGSGRRAIALESGGPLVGVLRRSVYRQGSLRLEPGDILAAFTAGVTECRNTRGEEWGYRRLIASIEAANQLPAREIVERVIREADAFREPAETTDDMTLWLGRLDEALSTHVPLEAEVEEGEPAALAA